jgi:hypothetical protein
MRGQFNTKTGLSHGKVTEILRLQPAANKWQAGDSIGGLPLLVFPA